MNPERAIEVLRALAAEKVATHAFDEIEACHMGAAALRDVAALRAELAEAKKLLSATHEYVNHGSGHEPIKCPICKNDQRWPVKEGT